MANLLRAKGVVLISHKSEYVNKEMLVVPIICDRILQTHIKLGSA